MHGHFDEIRSSTRAGDYGSTTDHNESDHLEQKDAPGPGFWTKSASSTTASLKLKVVKTLLLRPSQAAHQSPILSAPAAAAAEHAPACLVLFGVARLSRLVRALLISTGVRAGYTSCRATRQQLMVHIREPGICAPGGLLGTLWELSRDA